jgi:uncharacterized protein (DUF433 family)
VERVPGRVSGVPTLKHSRLPADSIVSNSDSGESPEEIADMFGISVDLVRGILEYAAQDRRRNSTSPRP